MSNCRFIFPFFEIFHIPSVFFWNGIVSRRTLVEHILEYARKKGTQTHHSATFISLKMPLTEILQTAKIFVAFSILLVFVIFFFLSISVFPAFRIYLCHSFAFITFGMSFSPFPVSFPRSLFLFVERFFGMAYFKRLRLKILLTAISMSSSFI